MNRTVMILGLVLFCFGLAGGTRAGESTTMTGSYVAGEGAYPDRGELEAVFTPTGDGIWDVVFRFDFQGQDYTFRGTAEGSLSDGFLTGRVNNKSGERTFIFRGTTVEGLFRGTHAELEGGGETPTGTMIMKEKE